MNCLNWFCFVNGACFITDSASCCTTVPASSCGIPAAKLSANFISHCSSTWKYETFPPSYNYIHANVHLCVTVCMSLIPCLILLLFNSFIRLALVINWLLSMRTGLLQSDTFYRYVALTGKAFKIMSYPMPFTNTTENRSFFVCICVYVCSSIIWKFGYVLVLKTVFVSLGFPCLLWMV